MTSLTAGRSKRGLVCLQNLTALLAISAVQVGAAELRVTTEYVYPTKYTGVMPPSGAAVGGGAVSVNQPLAAIPGDFAVRETGVLFGPGVTLSHLNSEAAVVSLLEQRNKNGNTELMVAATLGDGEQVRRLLARGATPNVKSSSGSTALMFACRYDEFVSLLIHLAAFAPAEKPI